MTSYEKAPGGAMNASNIVSSTKPTVSLRLDPALVKEFRVEAARRGVRLNVLFEEMWQLYKERHDATT